jgi:UDP:flavonoid glycosyltransferase YjiC (YdhE family)
LTSILINAVNKAGVRVIIASGWTDLGNEQLQAPENIYFLDKIPYDWLFPRVSPVIHHGGAGSTSTALKYGKPAVIVPFIGDNYLWGAIVARAGAGAHAPIPYTELTAEALAEAIRECCRMDKGLIVKWEFIGLNPV